MYNLHQQHKAYQRFNQVQLIFLPNGLILGAVDGSAQLWWRHSCLQKPLSLEQSATKATLWRCLNRTVGSCCKKVQVSLRPSVLCQPRQLAGVRRVKWGTSVPVNSRAQWECQNENFETGYPFSIVKLNFNVGLFSCFFWFEAIFISKSAIFCRSLFTREKGPK